MAQNEQQIPKVSPDMFEVVGRSTNTDALSKKQVSYWKEVFYRFSHNKLAVIGLVLLVIIAFMAIFAPVLYWLTYGLLSGLGMGIGYIAPVSTLVKWFPNRRGLATGMAVLGFGAGSLITAPVAANLMEAVGISNTYFILGISYFTLMILGALYIAPPKPGDVEEAVTTTKVKTQQLAQMSAREAVRTKQFWMLWAMHLINVTSGLMMISVASPMAQEIAGLSVAAAATMVGLMGLFNGGGPWHHTSRGQYIRSCRYGKEPLQRLRTRRKE